MNSVRRGYSPGGTREDFADGEYSYDVIFDIGGNSRLLHLRRALTSKGRLVIVGGETDGRWLGGLDRQLRAIMLSPFVSQKLGILGAKENSADLLVLRELLEAGIGGPIRPGLDVTPTTATAMLNEAANTIVAQAGFYTSIGYRLSLAGPQPTHRALPAKGQQRF